MSAWQAFFSAETRSRIGSTKAPVLPLPVRDWIIRSRFARTYGIVFAWTGINSGQLARAAASRTAADRSARLTFGSALSGSTTTCSSRLLPEASPATALPSGLFLRFGAIR